MLVIIGLTRFGMGYGVSQIGFLYWDDSMCLHHLVYKSYICNKIVTKMDIVGIIKKNKDFLSIKNIEKECGIPDSMLRGVIAGTRSLPSKYIRPLEEIWTRITSDSFVPVELVKKKKRSGRPSGVPVDFKKCRQAIGGYFVDEWGLFKPVMIRGRLSYP